MLGGCSFLAQEVIFDISVVLEYKLSMELLIEFMLEKLKKEDEN